MSVMNIMRIQKEIDGIKTIVNESSGVMPTIRLSRDGKNVIILMLDRSLGFYIPFLIEEKPELLEKYDGFTFYPQTLSFANMTNAGLPPIYGGYEYITEKMNLRSEKPLAEKHNEALQLMPFIFDDAGYEVTILDPTYANYKTPSDLHIYDEHPDIRAYNTSGFFTSPQYYEFAIATRRRNFFCYSLYKTAPLLFQPTLYTYGMYNETDALAGKKEETATTQNVENLYKATGMKIAFEIGYSVLTNLPMITIIEDGNVNTFTTLDNPATHEPVLLQMPDYVPAIVVDNTAYENDPITRTSYDGIKIELSTEDRLTRYHMNMGAYLELGKWMDFLRENDVYDNSRIIIVADHGTNQGYPAYKIGNTKYDEVICYNPVLMVKDFYSKGFSVNDQLMTNADVPTIAMQGLIDSPVNPNTGNPVSNDEKENMVFKIINEEQWNVIYNNGNTFLPSNWFAFQGNDIFDTEKWEKLGKF